VEQGAPAMLKLVPTLAKRLRAGESTGEQRSGRWNFGRRRVLRQITVPEKLQRNHANVLAHGVEHTGEILLRHMIHRLGRTDLAGLYLLDVGCGVRFAQTLINRSFVFGSYTGVDVKGALVRWLKKHIESRDTRFHFVHWPVYNAMFNEHAPPMSTSEALPVKGRYDLIMGFSLFTHLAPQDTALMLRFMRKAVRADGRVFFTAFCDEAVHDFEDRVPNEPLLLAYYNPTYLKRLIEAEGWCVLSHEPPAPFLAS
jgi:SAM-dependent methyltransferase